MWDGHIKMEDTHGHVKVELFPNGSFVTHDYQRFTDTGINKDGVLRGEIWLEYLLNTGSLPTRASTKMVFSTHLNPKP
jgi:hypothetical protein